MDVHYTGNGSLNIVGVPAFNSVYLRQLIRTNSFVAVQPLFAVAQDPAKEWTESYAALHHLRRRLKPATLAVHVGDGAHCRTGALFAFNSAHENICIDPAVNVERMERWREKYHATRIDWRRERAEDCVQQIVHDHWERTRTPAILTFVHAHVDTTQILKLLAPHTWSAAYTNACCHHGAQLVRSDDVVIEIGDQGEDWGILSRERRYQVLYPRKVEDLRY